MKNATIKQLVIDTAAYNGGIGLFENDKILGISYLNVPQTYSQRILYQIHTLMESMNLSFHDIDAVTFSMGPGSFTGLRIGLAVSKTLTFCLNIPLLMVSTLEAYAMSIPQNGFVAPLLDARKKEVFAALYEKKEGACTAIVVPKVTSIEHFISDLPQNKPVHFIGSGSTLYKEFIEENTGENSFFAGEETLLQVIPSLAALGYKKFKNNEFADTIFSEPFYIRRSEAEIAKDKKD